MADAPNASAPNASEAEYWGSTGGQKWVEHQGAMDRLLGGVTDALLAEARPQPGEKALDLGCGAGASALALAPLLEPGPGTVRFYRARAWPAVEGAAAASAASGAAAGEGGWIAKSGIRPGRCANFRV